MAGGSAQGRSELGFDDEGRPVLITVAARPYEDEHRERVRKYMTLMAFRIPALVLAAVAYGIWHNGLISLAIVAVSLPLPWMAVLIANDRPPRRAEEPRRFDKPNNQAGLGSGVVLPELERGTSDMGQRSRPNPETIEPD